MYKVMIVIILTFFIVACASGPTNNIDGPYSTEAHYNRYGKKIGYSITKIEGGEKIHYNRYGQVIGRTK